MKYLKEHNTYKIIKAIESHLNGYSLDDYDLKIISDYFDNDIPIGLKYEGELYRFVFF